MRWLSLRNDWVKTTGIISEESGVYALELILKKQIRNNVWGELVFCVMAAGWFCEKSG
jgi:hypothetical protein